MNTGNYQVIEQIGVTASGTLHLARHVQDGAAALLKLPAHDNAADGLPLKHKYALLQSLDVPEILHPVALLEEGARPALVLQHFGSESMDAVLARQARLALPVTLAIACQLTRALASMPQASCTTI